MAKSTRNGIFRSQEIQRDSQIPWRYKFHVDYELISNIILTQIILCRKLEIWPQEPPQMDFDEYFTKSGKSLKYLIPSEFKLISNYFISGEFILKRLSSHMLDLKNFDQLYSSLQPQNLESISTCNRYSCFYSLISA